MKNIFIITVGTRDIQFLKDEITNSNDFLIDENNSILCKTTNESIDVFENIAYPDYLCLSSPRNGGCTIVDNFKQYSQYIKMPLIQNVFMEIASNNRIHELIIVSTDQELPNDCNSSLKRNYYNDTVFFSEIIEKKIKEQYEEFSDLSFRKIVIQQNVVDVDYQYVYFGKNLNELIEDKDIENVFLLPQGGIDQINHALTLKLIQAFGDKVQIWQQSEALKPVKLNFTHFFLDDLSKHQIKSLIENGEYKGALSVTDSLFIKNKELKKNLMFASLRMDLLFDDAVKKVFDNTKQNLPQFYLDYRDIKLFCSDNCFVCFDEDERIKNYLFQTIEKLYIAEFFFKIGNYTKFTIQLHVFLENVIETYISSVTEFDVKKKYNAGRKLIDDFNKNYTDEVKIINETLKTKIPDKSDNLELSFPSLILIAKFFAQKNKHQFMLDFIGFICHVNGVLNKNKPHVRDLDKLRNDIAHKGKGVLLEDLIKATDVENAGIGWWKNELEIIYNHFSQIENPYFSMNQHIMNLANMKR